MRDHLNRRVALLVCWYRPVNKNNNNSVRGGGSEIEEEMRYDCTGETRLKKAKVQFEHYDESTFV